MYLKINDDFKKGNTPNGVFDIFKVQKPTIYTTDDVEIEPPINTKKGSILDVIKATPVKKNIDDSKLILDKDCEKNIVNVLNSFLKDLYTISLNTYSKILKDEYLESSYFKLLDKKHSLIFGNIDSFMSLINSLYSSNENVETLYNSIRLIKKELNKDNYEDLITSTELVIIKSYKLLRPYYEDFELESNELSIDTIEQMAKSYSI